MKGLCRFLSACFVVGLLVSCSSAKFLGEGEYLLNKVKVESDDKKVDGKAFVGHVRQKENARWFKCIKVPLGIYSMSRKSGSSWLDRTLRKMGEAPVVYDSESKERSCEVLESALQNMGYWGAYVTAEENYKRHKVTLTYHLHPGKVYRVDSVQFDIADTIIARQLEKVQKASLLKSGMVLDINVLESERERITECLRENGYYKFSKEYITYTADSIEGKKSVGLTMHLKLYQSSKEAEPTMHPVYTIDSVQIRAEQDDISFGEPKRMDYKGLNIYYRSPKILHPSVYAENNFLYKGRIYRASDVQRTYTSMGRLGALKYTNIRFVESLDSNKLNALLSVVPAQVQNISLELDGTNTAGDFGFAVSSTYQHKNIFKRSALLSVKGRFAYEIVNGLQGYDKSNYTDWGVETSLNFPRFMLPFFSSRFKNFRKSSEVGVQYNVQDRPEFTRRALSASLRFRWSSDQRKQHRIDLPEVNYVYMPSISPTFRDEYLNSSVSNSILKYNYEDLFIVRAGYSFSYTSANMSDADAIQKRSNYSFRFNAEVAGNTCRYIISPLFFKNDRSPNGQYALWNIAYAQYVKGDIDYVHNMVLDKRNSLVFHFGFGIAYPYGNSTILPFEKRYFSGGANSVRGWSVRSLGPGRFSGGDRKIDFINQTGDVKLDMNLEWRTLLLGKMLHGAFFIDAGNIWTLREYNEQPGGDFRLDSFWNEIAMAYGVGLRLDLGFIIARLDLGMKAMNPAFSIDDKNHFPILSPKWKRDRAWHFAVGYPF